MIMKSHNLLGFRAIFLRMPSFLSFLCIYLIRTVGKVGNQMKRLRNDMSERSHGLGLSQQCPLEDYSLSTRAAPFRTIVME